MIITVATTIADAVRLAVRKGGAGNYWKLELEEGELKSATFRNDMADRDERRELRRVYVCVLTSKKQVAA